MNGWTRVKDLQVRLQKQWNNGRLLTAQLTAEPLFPLRIPLKRPGPRELGERYGAVKDWVDGLVRQAGSGQAKRFELEWREVNHRQLGRNRLPVAAVFKEPADAFRFIGKQKQVETFDALCRQILNAFPELQDWLARKPLIVLEHAASWSRLLSVAKWLQANPRPHIYIRQLEIAHVDTKFIEKHRKLLAELLDIILPAAAVDPSARGVAAFEQRYGFLAKPVQIRFRLLDPCLYIHGLSDLQVPADDFAVLEFSGVAQLFIVENDINGLAFPDLEKSMVIFGLGYGLERLARAAWLSGKTIYYWGDIDTHGFAMLDQIRQYFPQTRSLLMDRRTLMDHQILWGSEPAPLNRDLMYLNPAEAALYDELRENQWAQALRLEQERVSYTCLKTALKALGIKSIAGPHRDGVNTARKPSAG